MMEIFHKYKRKLLLISTFALLHINKQKYVISIGGEDGEIYNLFYFKKHAASLALILA